MSIHRPGFQTDGILQFPCDGIEWLRRRLLEHPFRTKDEQFHVLRQPLFEFVPQHHGPGLIFRPCTHEQQLHQPPAQPQIIGVCGQSLLQGGHALVQSLRGSVEIAQQLIPEGPIGGKAREPSIILLGEIGPAVLGKIGPAYPVRIELVVGPHIVVEDTKSIPCPCPLP